MKMSLISDFSDFPALPVASPTAPASEDLRQYRDHAHHEAFLAFLRGQQEELRAEMATAKARVAEINRLVRRNSENLPFLMRERDQISSRQSVLMNRALEIQSAIRYAMEFMDS